MIHKSVDTLLNRNPDAARFSVFNERAVFQDPSAIDMMPASRMLYVVDTTFGGLAVVNTSTDEWQLLSPDEGSSYPFSDPRRLLVDEVNGRAWVIDHGYADPLVIDLDTGQRSQLTGPGESLADSQDLVLDHARNRLLVFSQMRGQTTSSSFGSGKIISVDLNSGERQLLSSNASPPGDPEFHLASSIAFDSAGDRLLLLNATELVSIDPISGARQLVLEEPVCWLTNSDIDELGSRLLVVTRAVETGQPCSAFAVDLASAAKSDLPLPMGEGFTGQLRYDDSENRLFFIRGRLGMLDLTTGEVIHPYY